MPLAAAFFRLGSPPNSLRSDFNHPDGAAAGHATGCKIGADTQHATDSRRSIPEKRGTAPTALRILIVEDNVVIAMLLEATFVDIGHGACAIEGTEPGP